MSLFVSYSSSSRSSLAVRIAMAVLSAALVGCSDEPTTPEPIGGVNDENSLVLERDEALLAAAEQNPESADNEKVKEGKSEKAESVEKHASFVKVFWGYLVRKPNVKKWVEWNGSMNVDDGSLTLMRSIFWDAHDKLMTQQKSSALEWNSKTRGHFDGFIAKVRPSSPGAHLSVATAPYTREFSSGELAAGVNRIVTVDSENNQFSIASVPDNGCSGFVWGTLEERTEKESRFAGTVTSGPGVLKGKLVFKSVSGKIDNARLLSAEGAVVATGTGSLTEGKLKLKMEKSDGEVMNVDGIHTAATHGKGGALSATYTCK